MPSKASASSQSPWYSHLLCCLRQPSDSRGGENRAWLRQQRQRSREIDRELREEKERRRKRQMILLLGAGESGKSTFLKQMRIINGKKFTRQEVEKLKMIIYENTFNGIVFLLHARKSLSIPWGTGDAGPAAQAGQRVTAYYESFRSPNLPSHQRISGGCPFWTEDEFLGQVDDMRLIWSDAGIKTAFDHRHQVVTESFSENARYYLNRLNFIGIKNYMPTDEDIVWSRQPTTAIIEEEIFIHNASLLFVDVGGQTKERRKWCYCFTEMTSVLFLIASSHYDEHFFDKVTGQVKNKLVDAMLIFQSLINHVAFQRVSIIMFFNKTDVLREKIQSKLSSIRDEFANFPAKRDPFNLTDVQTFLVQAFISLVDPMTLVGDDPSASLADRSSTLPRQASRHNSSASGDRSHHLSAVDSSATRVRRLTSPPGSPVGNAVQSGIGQSGKRMIYKHFTTAIDKRNIETVFHAMQDTVLHNNLRRILMN